MFDAWIGNMNMTVIVLALSVAVILPLQLVLCFRVKSLFVRLLPVIILSGTAAAFLGMCLFAADADRTFYAVCAVDTAFTVLKCGLGWGIWKLAAFQPQSREAAR